MTSYKARKVRLYPTPAQVRQLELQFRANRWCWNQLLEIQKERYKNKEKHLSEFGMNYMLKPLREKVGNEWVLPVSANAFLAVSKQLANAYKGFFDKTKGEPNFKSRKNPRASATFSESLKVFPKEKGNGRLQMPKFTKKNTIKFRGSSQEAPAGGTLKTVTVTRNSIGQYFASLSYEITKDPVPTLPFGEDTTIGIDLGAKTFATLSDGRAFHKPKSVEALAPRIVKLQQKLARCEKGSNRRKRVRHKLAKLHIHQSNRRLDWLHKLTRQLVDENQVNCFAVEKLGVASMLQTAPSSLARKVQDSCFGMFPVLLAQKLEAVGKTLGVIDQYAPSSKTCSSCGHLYKELTLAEREWTCASCGETHDRDLNASKNIKQMWLAQCGVAERNEPSGGRLADILPFADGFAEDMTELGSPDDEVSESNVKPSGVAFTLVPCVSSRKGASQVKRLLPSPKGCFGTERLG
jgi:putative transposase